MAEEGKANNERNSMQSAFDLLNRSVNVLQMISIARKSEEGMELVGKIKGVIDLVQIGNKKDRSVIGAPAVERVNGEARRVNDKLVELGPGGSVEAFNKTLVDISESIGEIRRRLFMLLAENKNESGNKRVLYRDPLSMSKKVDKAQLYLEVIKESHNKIVGDIGSLELETSRIGQMAESLGNDGQRIRKILDDAEKALGGVTRAALASSFNARAKASLWIGLGWVVALVLTLLLGIMWGNIQIDHLADLSKANSNSNYFWLRSILAVMSFAAPVWMAWLATKQLSERFRIAEDYSYKAAISAAYEGYKKEANAIGKEHEEKLFETALGAVRMHPLRHLNSKIHGSPWHEALDTPAAMEAFKALPKLIGELKDKPLSKKSGESKNDEGEAEEKKEK